LKSNSCERAEIEDETQTYENTGPKGWKREGGDAGFHLETSLEYH
jgi:hypothetical protein